jgi:hypothetical protein
MVALAAFALGAIVGTVGLARWYIWRINKPEVARRMLKNAYYQSHSHWLARDQNDSRPVCPCCGWSEDWAETETHVGPRS